MRKLNLTPFIVFLFIFSLLAACQPNQPEVSYHSEFPNAPKLIVEEYEIISVEEDTPDHFGFEEYLAESTYNFRSEYRFQNPEQMTKKVNEDLAPFGFSIHQNPIMSSYDFELFQGETVLLDHIYQFSTVSFNEAEDDFAISFNTKDYKTYTLQKDGVIVQDFGKQAKGPVLVNDQLVYADLVDEEIQVIDLNESKVLFSAKAAESLTAIKGIWSWAGHWVLETADAVYINGLNLNQAENKAEIFHWRLIDDLPFYFYTESKGDLPYGIHFAGEDLSEYRYETIVHGNFGEPAAFNPASNENMVWFYAARDGFWYYVEAGVYED